MKVWAVYVKQEFYGYSESLGAGKESKELVQLFSKKECADKFILANEGKYNDDERLVVEEISVVDEYEEKTQSCSQDTLKKLFKVV